MLALVVAHGGGADSGAGFLLLVLPTGLILLSGLLLIFGPIVNQAGQPPPRRDQDDLASRVLGEDEARELRATARRQRALRRRALRQALTGRAQAGDDAQERRA
jgi:hypothetical protein